MTNKKALQAIAVPKKRININALFAFSPTTKE